MTKHIFAILCVTAISLGSYSQQARLSGKIMGPTGPMVYLSEPDPKTHELIRLDSASVENGNFLLELTLDSLKHLYFENGTEVTKLVMAPGDDIHLVLHTSYFDETIHYTGKGSGKNQALSGLFLAEEAASQEFTSHLSHLDNIDTTAVFKKLEERKAEMEKVLDDYLMEYPGLRPYITDLRNQNKLFPKWYRKRVRNKFRFDALVANEKGKQVIDFSAVGTNGNPHSVAEYKGKPVLLDFWATWCVPCKQQMPALREIEKVYGEKVHIISVAMWCDEEEWKKMAMELGLENNLFVAKGGEEELKKAYMLDYIPRYILLDKDLNIVDLDAPWPSSGELEAKLDALVN